MFRSVLFLFFFLAGSFCAAEEIDSDTQIVERYWEILTKSPKRGAAFDRVYGHYVDTGQSDLLYNDCKKVADDHPDDAAASILFGLVAERRNKNEQAIEAYRKAATLEPDNHLSSLYLGELLLKQRNIHEAINVLEQAAERLKTNSESKNDLRTVLQTLANAYERFGNSEKALETWNQIAALFPNNPDVLVQIAEYQEFDGKLDEALKQYRRLIKMTDDHLDRVRFSLAAIDIMLRQGNDAAALADLDSLLNFLDTESYLTDSVRDRIDRIFERNRDENRQIEFYRKRIENEPNDTASVMRLIKTLQKIGKNTEAEKILTDAVKSSPSNVPLRLMLIGILTDRKDFAAAIEQCEAVDKIEPDRIDHLTRWGSLLLQNPAENESQRKAEAVKIWMRIAENAPDDPAAAVHAADLFFRNKFYDEAEICYKKALALQSDDFSYREFLAMFYHQQKQKEKVLATLISPDDEQFNLQNIEETGTLLLSFGYINEASQILRKAAQTATADLPLQCRYIESLLRSETPENIQTAADVFIQIERNIADDEQFFLFLQQEVQLLKSLRKVSEMINFLETKTNEKNYRSAWHLAACYQAEVNFSAAAASLAKALNFAEKPSPALLRFAAELYEQTGETNQAVKLYQKLVTEDSRRNGDYWKRLVTLQIQRGELPQAVETSKKLLGRGTENAERLRFVADLFLSINKRDEAVKLLQQALIHEPGNPDVLRLLAQTFAESNRHEDAVELLWVLFDRLDSIPAKLSLIETLTNEYNQLGKPEELTGYLKQLSRNYERRRESLQALARVLVLNDDYEEAQNVLESLLDLPDENKNDSESSSLWVLRELVSVTEKNDDFAAAVHYQELICQKKNEPAEQDRLFWLYNILGETEKSNKLFLDLVLRQNDGKKRLDLIDTMIRREEYESVGQVLGFLEIHEPENWQIMFRRMLIEANQNRPVEMLVREFRSLKVNENPVPYSLPHIDVGLRKITFSFADSAPSGFLVSLDMQYQFLNVLFHQSVQKTRRFQVQGITMPDFDMIKTFQDTKFIVLGWLLREAMNKDFTTPGDTPTVMRTFRNVIEELRDMLPADSSKHDVLTERLRLEVFLLQILAFDRKNSVFPTGMIKLQIDERVCQQTIWQIVRKFGIDNEPEWQTALFKIFITECINELVAERFKSVLPSDAKLSEKLLQILNGLCFERKIPPMDAEDRNRLINYATYLVKQSATDHKASLQNQPMTLKQKTDHLLAIWKTAQNKNDLNFQRIVDQNEVFRWILTSQRRSDDVKHIDQIFRTTTAANGGYAINLASIISHQTLPVNENLILFLSLSGYDPLESQLKRMKERIAGLFPPLSNLPPSNIDTQYQVCLHFFSGLTELLNTERMKRYDIFTSAELGVFELHRHEFSRRELLSPSSKSAETKFARQLFGFDPNFAAAQQFLNPDQLERLTELDRSIKQLADFSFQLLNDLQQSVPDDSIQLDPHPPQQKISLTRYRSELERDKPIDRSLIYDLLSDQQPTGNFSSIDKFFFRLILLCRALDTKTKFAAVKIEDRVSPVRKNHTEHLRQFLENKKHSTIATDRAWSHYFSEKFGELLTPSAEQPKALTTKPAGPDAELLQLLRQLENVPKDQTLPPAEKLALALLYAKLGQFEKVMPVIDSIEWSSPRDLTAREWIAAHLAMRHDKNGVPDSAMRKRGEEAVNRLLNFRLSDRDSMNLMPVLQYYHRGDEAKRILDNLIVTVSDQRLLTELLYEMRSAGELQKESAAKIALRILQNSAFLQNTRRLTADIYLLETAMKTLREQNRTEAAAPMLESRLQGLRDKTDSRILLAKLYLTLDRLDEAKRLAIELSQQPSPEPERRQMIISLLTHFGLQKELDAMNRILTEKDNRP